MGCFNVTGTLSGLSISAGTKCVFFPLYYRGYNDKLNHVARIVSNDGAYAFYAPFCLPLVGYYNDYGSLENIEENDNTKMLESLFDCSIQNFVNEVNGYRENIIVKTKIL